MGPQLVIATTSSSTVGVVVTTPMTYDSDLVILAHRISDTIDNAKAKIQFLRLRGGMQDIHEGFDREDYHARRRGI